MTWEIVRRRSTAADFHASPIPDVPTTQIWIHELTAPAVALGSTQRDDVVDLAECERLGVDVVRRRSGGGAVWLVPLDVVWVDVIIPAGGPGWSDDIHRPMVWLGRHLARAAAAVGVSDAIAYEGPMLSTEHSRLVCFDGLGPGEVTIGDAKLVGISQRRTRSAARLQCCWYADHDPVDLTRLLTERTDPADLRPVATMGRDRASAMPQALADMLNGDVTRNGDLG